jgi:hypothetical protein
MSDEPRITMTFLLGEMPFIPPKYYAVQRADGWWIECDQGINLGSFASRAEAVLAARSGGMIIERD